MIRCYIGHSKGTVDAEIAKLTQEGEGIAELNRAVLDGDVVDLETLQVHCDTLPFLGGAKLVVVRGLLSRSLKEKPLRDGLLAYLPRRARALHVGVGRSRLAPGAGDHRAHQGHTGYSRRHCGYRRPAQRPAASLVD